MPTLAMAAPATTDESIPPLTKHPTGRHEPQRDGPVDAPDDLQPLAPCTAGSGWNGMSQ
jgi:hypothetical protein